METKTDRKWSMNHRRLNQTRHRRDRLGKAPHKKLMVGWEARRVRTQWQRHRSHPCPPMAAQTPPSIQ